MNRQTAAQTKVRVTAVPLAIGGLLQRACACGQHTSGGECEECSKKRIAETAVGGAMLHRRAAGNREPDEVPEIVHDVLGSPGQPLDAATRSFFEPRFGHDFSGVRVHTDARAAESARTVNALAYTVGRDVVFGSGQYAPGAAAGRRLLGHELAHAVQQSESQIAAPINLTVAAADTKGEREAEAVEAALPLDRPLHSGLADRSGPMIQRKDDPPTPEERERQKHHAGSPLNAADKAQIAKLKIPTSGGTLTAFKEGPRFVLHDTASVPSKKELANVEAGIKKKGVKAGPLGVGYAAEVLTADAPVRQRGSLFEASRPTVTEYERGENLLPLKDRVTAFQAVWKVTQETKRVQILADAMKSVGVTDKDLKEDGQNPKRELETACTPTEKEPCVHTMAQWAVARICDQAPKDLAAKGKEGELTASCATLKPVLDARKRRIPSTVNVEIVQLKGCPPGKSCDDCHPGENPVALANPAYTDNQYESVKALYLEAALQADVFPHITTHFWVDADVAGHCDPRCFDLTRLYRSLSKDLKHQEGDTYGVDPRYGTNWGVDTIWWNPKVCGGAHP